LRTPEYWVELAKQDFDQVVDLYQRHVSTAVQPDDLKLQQDIAFNGEILRKGSYNPYNEWNTSKGVIHLTHMVRLPLVAHRPHNPHRVHRRSELGACSTHTTYKRIKGDFDFEISRLPPGNKLFFSEAANAGTSADIPVTWNAFPLSIKRNHPTDLIARWNAADRLVRQHARCRNRPGGSGNNPAAR
jgi:hypothetical protein